MALITCPECSKEVSDGAASCPHCGCPVADAQPQPTSSTPELCGEPVPICPEKKPHSKADLFIGIFCITVIVLALIGLCIPLMTRRSDSSTPYVQRDFSVSSFPYAMDISGKSVPIERITFLELYANHGYTGYLVISIDRRTLSDDELYWLMHGIRMNWELDTSAWLSPHSIDSDNVSMHFLKCYTTDDYIYHFYCTDLYQDSLAGSYVLTTIYYEPEGSYSDRLTYSYNFYFTDKDYHNSIACLTSEERELLVKATSAASK